jgi:hypothetical protein
MNRRHFNKNVLIGSTAVIAHLAPSNLLSVTLVKPGSGYYEKGSTISPDIFVTDQENNQHDLISLLSQSDPDSLNVLFIFGAGAMGNTSRPGGIWCRDTFEDLSIFRTLVDKYKNSRVNFIPIASPPVFHTHTLGAIKDVFINYADDTKEFQDARKIFVDSTQDAVETGIIPIQPYYDIRMRLILNKGLQSSFPMQYGEQPGWLGSFRAVNESQTYGVPNYWFANSSGEIVSEPFRGNIYHPHGGPVTINYTVKDIMAAIDQSL